MKTIRIIPRIDIKGNQLVKGINLEGLRVLGNPESFAQYYTENGADEIILMDIVASLYERNSIKEIVSRIADTTSIPLTVGGGIRNLNDIKEILRSGADKVSINTAAINNANFISESSKEFGSSTIVVSAEVIKVNNEYLCFTDNGREYTGVNAKDWLKEVQERGAGEILLTFIENEGTRRGYNIEGILSLANEINIPLIIHGGAGQLNHFKDALNTNLIDGFAISSLLHYNTMKEMSSISKYSEGNTEYLKGDRDKMKMENFSIDNIKEFCVNNTNYKFRF